jgi:lipoprotein-releasing system ATP-binding protein
MSDDAAPTPVVQLEGVIKDYGDDVKTRVLRGIDLSVDPGELVCLIGPSGCGKSTLLNIIGLLDRATDGHVHIVGQRVGTLDDEALTELRAKRLGFVFQFHHLVSALSAVENVMVPLAIESGRMSGEIRRRALEVLDQVGLLDRADELPRRLSGGQQQRVAIARAIVSRPPLVLADEPTGNLDTVTSTEVFELMRRLNHELGMAFLVVTHDPRIAEQSDRIIEMIDGRIVADASTTRTR